MHISLLPACRRFCQGLGAIHISLLPACRGFCQGLGAMHISQLLQRDGRNGLITTSLATAGKTGTLRDTFLSGPGAGTMRAKTGTLNGVKSLSGMFPLDDGRTTFFSLIMNGSGASTLNFYRPIWNNLAAGLASGNARLNVDDLLPVANNEEP